MNGAELPAAALAGVSVGVQAQGVWVGNRQLFIRFAAEAETATMYTSDALVRDLQRLIAKTSVHSVSVTGRDPLANGDFLFSALTKAAMTMPVMLDVDGQRPEEIARLAGLIGLVQVTLDPAAPDSAMERGLAMLVAAAGAGCQHAFVAEVGPEASDSQIMRTIESIRDASPETDVVILPPAGVEPEADNRWATLLEQAMRLHHRTRLGARLHPSTGVR